ncbi:MAG: sortase [Candidatus Dojkabacteria bacterium]|nr:MAG: sortase [Candidatus Dojkabacteria bacterium]
MKLLLKLFSIFMLLLFAGAVGFLIAYPNYGDLTLYKSQLDSYNITHNFTLQLFTKLSPLTFDAYQADYRESSSVEYADPALLIKYLNEGKVKLDLEKKNTTIRVDSVNIGGSIHDGENPDTMLDGPWRFPLSSGPGERGNMVIFGHRYAELPPSTNTFFNLDKIRVGDKIVVEQEGDIAYTYTVVSTQVVEKNDRTVLQSYGDHRITLITCTPLWTSQKRLAIVGILDRGYRRI